MKVYSNFKFKMIPNEEQKEILDVYINTSIFIYNYYLNYSDFIKKVNNRNITLNDKEWVKDFYNNNFPDLDNIDISIIFTSLELADNLYKDYINCRIDKLDYKCSDNYGFYMTMNEDKDIIIDLDKSIINLPNINNIKIENIDNVKEINDNIIRALIEKKDGEYYVSIYLENSPVVLKGLSDKVKKLTDEYSNLVYKLERSEKRLKGLEQGLLRKEKGSNNYAKMLLKISKLERKIYGLKKNLKYFEDRYFK